MAKIKKIYVIRRNLFFTNVKLPKVGPIAHSALLLEDINNKYSILEYGVESNPNGVTLRDININEYFTNDNFTEFSEGNNKWYKQEYGNDISNRNCPVTNNILKDIMTDYANQSEYNLLKHNCHMSQEYVRNAIGLTVDHSYTFAAHTEYSLIGPEYDVCSMSNSHNIDPISNLFQDNIDPISNSHNIDPISNLFQDNIEYYDEPMLLYDIQSSHKSLENDFFEGMNWLQLLTNPQEALITFSLNKILYDNPELSTLCDFLTHGKPTINSSIDFLNNYIQSIDYTDYTTNNLFDNFCKYSEELKLGLDLIFDKKGLKHEIGILADKITNTNIFEVFNDFHNHANTSRKIIDTTILTFDVLGYVFPVCGIIGKTMEIIESVFDWIKSIRTHTRVHEYHGIEFQYKWKWHVKVLKGEVSNTVWIDNDFLNIHIEKWAKGGASHAQNLAEALIDEQMMAHMGIPKDILDSYNIDGTTINGLRTQLYISNFRHPLFDYYRDHGYITQEQEDSWLKGDMDKHTNENINLKKDDLNYINDLYEREHQDYSQHHGEYNDMNILKIYPSFSFLGKSSDDFNNQFELYRALTCYDKYNDKIIDIISQHYGISRVELKDWLNNTLDCHEFDNVQFSETDKELFIDLYNKFNDDYIGHINTCNDLNTYLHSLELNFTGSLFVYDVIMRSFKTIIWTIGKGIMNGIKSINMNYFGSMLLYDFVIPLSFKYINKFIIHNIVLFNNLSMLQLGGITMIIPILANTALLTNQLNEGNIKPNDYACKMCSSVLNMGISIGTNVALQKAIIIKSGISISLSLKTGLIKTAVIASTVKTAIVIKSGIVTIAIGASTIKAFGIGIIIMAIGSLIILIEKIISNEINKNSPGKTNIYDNMPKTIYDNMPKTIYDNIPKTIYDNMPKTIYDDMYKASNKNSCNNNNQKFGQTYDAYEYNSCEYNSCEYNSCEYNSCEYNSCEYKMIY